MAQYWVGDYYLRRGDYIAAELNYERLRLNTNFVRSDLMFSGQLMSARSALLRKPSDAKSYITNLLDLDDRSACPPSLRAQAWFLFGEAILAEGATVTTNSLQRFKDAITAFGRITNFFTGDRLEPLARGKIADCLLQLAAQDTNNYTAAFNEYQQIAVSTSADITARSQAECGLALIREKQSDLNPEQQRKLLEEALNYYLNVTYEKNVRSGESADLFWVRKAGLEAGRVAERLQKFAEAIRLYERLIVSLPPLKAELQQKIAALKTREKKL